MIGVLYRLRKPFPLSSMLQLYKSLIHSHLEYCSHLRLLIEKLQNRAMRILGCSDLVKENILPMSHRRNVGSLSLLYRYFHGSFVQRTSWTYSYPSTSWSINSICWCITSLLSCCPS